MYIMYSHGLEYLIITRLDHRQLQKVQRKYAEVLIIQSIPVTPSVVVHMLK